jgi:2-phosphoglycerate kinase
MNYPKVIYLGGAPMVGKTAVARVIASRLKYGCISTDDIGAVIASVTDEKSHQAFHYMTGRDYREYYISSSIDELITDIDRQHAALWPAILTLLRNHSNWGTPVVIEGWALRPHLVSQLTGDIAGIFLLADDHMIEERTIRHCESSDFTKGATDEDKMIRRYIQRSLWYNEQLRTEVTRLGLTAITITSEMRPEYIADECMQLLSIT